MMGTELMVNLGKGVIVVLAVMTVGLMVYGMEKDFQVEVDSPFFGKWKFSKVSRQTSST